MITARTHLTPLVAGVILFIGCGGETKDAPPVSGESAGKHQEEAVQPVDQDLEESTEGLLAFTVDSSEKSFDFLPASANSYTPLASTLRAHPVAGSTESIAISFMSIDLKKLELPTDLPPVKDPSKPMDPLSAMATVGFGYVDAEGVEWAGPGKLRVESFGADGVVVGTFDQVTLPHTDKEHPDITLTGGTFRARITSPW